MQDSTGSRVNLGITLLGLGLAAYIAAGAGPTAQLVAGIMGYLVSVAGNQTAKWLGDNLDAVPKDQQDIFCNHHLRTIITNGAAIVVAKVIGDKEHFPSGTLASARKHIGAALDKALADPKSPLAELYDFNLPDILAGFVKRKGKVKLLTVEVWEQFLDTLPTKLWPKERRDLAKALHTHFPEALWGLVKEDAAKNGEAAAALELLYLSRILEATEGTAKREDTAPLTRHIAKLIARLDRRAAEHFQIVFAQNKSLARKLDDRAQELGGKLNRLAKQEAAGTKATHEKLDGLRETLDRQVAAAPLHAYYKSLREQFSTYENLGLPVPERDSKEGEQDKPIPIRKLFVAPAFTNANFSPEAFDGALREGKTPALPLLPRLAPAKSRTVLLADPGMGKSTLIQWLISTLADDAVPLEQRELRGAIPLPFILRDLVSHMPQEVKGWNWDALVDAFRQWRHRGKGAPLAAPLTSDDALFRTILASSDAFFLIDGLDEIGDPQRRLAIRDAIWEGFDKYPEARWLITSRIVGYEHAEVDRMWVRATNDTPFPETGVSTGEVFDPTRVPVGAESVISLDSPAESADGNTRAPRRRHDLRIIAPRLHLAPFDDTQQLTFAQNWYRPRLGNAAGTQRAEDFIEAVRRHPHTQIISRVPNLLYLLSLLYRHKAHLPDGRALVYEAISLAYLSAIDLDKHLPDSLAIGYKPEEKELLLAVIAMRMQQIRVTRIGDEKGEILVSRKQLEEWPGPLFGGRDDRVACDELHRFLDHIAKRSGLLLPRGEGVFGFAHLSFQEYYAACYLKREFERILNQQTRAAHRSIFRTTVAEPAKENEELIFAEMAASPPWHEPLLFLVEKLRSSPYFTIRILEWMFPHLADEPEEKGKRPIAAAQLLARLSLDQEISLEESQRRQLWETLWRAHLAQQPQKDFWLTHWHLAPSLLAASAYQSDVLMSAASLKPKLLVLNECTALTDLRPLSGLHSARIIFLDQCTALSDLSPLNGLHALQELGLHDCISLTDLTPLSRMRRLRSLWLHRCTNISDLEPLRRLRSLQFLGMSECTKLSDLKPLSGLRSLQWLSVDETSIRELDPLRSLAYIRDLSLSSCTDVSDLEPLSGLSSLTVLNLDGCVGVCDLKPLTRLRALAALNLDGCTIVTDLEPVRGMGSLKTLDLRGCIGITDLEPLAKLRSLRTLDLSGCTGISDLKPLSKLASLKRLYLSGCTAVSDMEPLSRLPSLKALTLSGSTQVSDKSLALLKARQPSLEISR